MSAKQFGEAWVYSPIQCCTGALHTQPSSPAIQPLMSGEFTNGFKVFFDLRGALDAPDTIPSGGVRADDFEPAEKGRLLIAHTWRAGAFA